MKRISFSKGFFIIGIITISFMGAGLLMFLRNKTTQSNDTIVIGMMSGWPPFMSINTQGQYEGFDVDVAQELAARLKKKCEIVDMGSLVSLFIALEKNKIDMIFSGLDITEKRKQQMDMVYYVGGEVREYYLMFWDKIPEGIKTIQDLKNYPNPVVAFEPGVSTEKLLDQYDFIIKKPISSLTDQLLDLQYGKSLALFRQLEVAKIMCEKNPNIKLLSVPLPIDFQIYGMGIALKKGNNTLTKQVQEAIKIMQNDGTLKKLEMRWKV